MDWQEKDTLPAVRARKSLQIIIASQDKKSQKYDYNVVFYHAPMKVWYGGPGIRVRDKDIELWASIPPPK